MNYKAKWIKYFLARDLHCLSCNALKRKIVSLYVNVSLFTVFLLRVTKYQVQ